MRDIAIREYDDEIYIEPAALAKLMGRSHAAIAQRMKCGSLLSKEVPTDKLMIPVDAALTALETVNPQAAKRFRVKLKAEGWL